MTVNFPNPSRSFDAKRNGICFWGYYSVIEISFFLEVNALQKLCPNMDSSEAGFLKAFDAERKRINKVADRLYSHDRNDIYAYILTAEDF